VKLFLLRHGDADAGFPDGSRKLSAYGRQQVISVAREHVAQCKDVQMILTSPLQRASETADLFTTYGLTQCRRQTVDYLLPTTSVKTVERNLQAVAYSCLLMVGHLPMLENLINYFAGDSGARMETASIASLSMEFPMQGSATLDWVHYSRNLD